MNKKLINNPDITNWLNQYGNNRYGTDIDAYVAECINSQLHQYSPSVYARDMYSTTSFCVSLPYAVIRDLFGSNFIGLIVDDGKDYSYIVEGLTEFDKKHNTGEGYHEYNEKVKFERYYEFADCPFVIRLNQITVLHIKGNAYTLLPDVTLACDIVNKAMLERMIK